MQHDELTAELWKLPLSERMGILMLSILERDSEALRGVQGLLGILVTLASNIGAASQVKLARDLHAAADHLDGPRLPSEDLPERVVH